MALHASLAPLLAQLPRTASADWPQGEPFVEALHHGTMSVEVFAPRDHDAQKPHDQDELYFIMGGGAKFDRAGEQIDVTTGDVLFVPAGAPHHFEAMSNDFVSWVVFWGPAGGEAGT